MTRLCIALAMLFVAPNRADRIALLRDGADEPTPEAADTNKEVEKLKAMVDPEGTVCDSTEIKSILKGEFAGTEPEQMFKAIQEIPWHTVHSIANTFTEKSKHKIDELSLEGEKLQAQLEKKRSHNQWQPIDSDKVYEVFEKAIDAGFTDKTWSEPKKLADLTRCGARRPRATEWSGDKKKRGTIKAPMGASDKAIEAFNAAADGLFSAEGSQTVYIDTAALQEKCCVLFGLPGDCIQSSLVNLDEKCDDICRGMDVWAKKRNTDQGFLLASEAGSVDELEQKLAEVVAEVERLQGGITTCETSLGEVEVFRQEIAGFQEEVHKLKKSYEECREGLYDAEDVVADTKYILDESQEKLDKLTEALSKGGAQTKKIVPLLDKATEKVKTLQELLGETQAELESTNATLLQLTEANTVITQLQQKVSALLLQMVATFDRVVGERIRRAGLEQLDFEAIVQDFPREIRRFEEGAFSTLDTAVDNLTSYCAEAEHSAKLQGLKDHPEIAEFCGTLEAYDNQKIGGQLEQAIQEHVDEFRDWFARVAQEYKKFQGWLEPATAQEKSQFEPVGYTESHRAFSRTEFFKAYLAQWERESGAFFQAYNKMMDNFAKQADKQSQLLVQEMRTEKNFLAEQQKLDKLLVMMKKVAATMKTVGVSKAEEAKLFKAYSDKLGELEKDAERKQHVMEEAKKKFDDSWQSLVGFHKKRTSLTMILEDTLQRITQAHDAARRRPPGQQQLAPL